MNLEEISNLLSKNYLKILRKAGFLDVEDGYVVSNVKIIRYNSIYLMMDFPQDDTMGVYIGDESFRLADQLVSEFKNRRFDKVLDMGTGTGIFAFSLAPFSKSVIGVDINPHSVKFSKKEEI